MYNGAFCHLLRLPTYPWSAPKAHDGSDFAWPLERLQAFSYSVGVLYKGDGSVYTTTSRNKRNNSPAVTQHRVELKNKSRAFLHKFDQQFALVLGRKPVKVHGPYFSGHAILQYRSKEFVSWWKKQTLEDFKPLIEAFPVEYLRGRFDSDGNVRSSEVTLCGAESQRSLMEFERTLCARLGMRTGRIRPYGHPGEVFFIGKKEVRSKQQKLRFYVNVHDFRNQVGNLSVEWRNKDLKLSRQIRGWTPWSKEIRDRAVQLMNDHTLGCKAVTIRLGMELGSRVPYSTVYSWLKRGRLSWGGYEGRILHGCPTSAGPNLPQPTSPTLNTI